MQCRTCKIVDVNTVTGYPAEMLLAVATLVRSLPLPAWTGECFSSCLNVDKGACQGIVRFKAFTAAVNLMDTLQAPIHIC